MPIIKKMVTETKKEIDLTTGLAIGAGVAAVGFGLWFYLSKKGVAPGTEITAQFTFDYFGSIGGTYVLQVSLGHIRAPLPVFDHIEGLTWTQEVALTGPDSYTSDFLFKLPDFIDAGTYDAEALIRTSEMHWLDYFIKYQTKSAVIVSG